MRVQLLKPSMHCDARQHLRSDFVTVMKGESRNQTNRLRLRAAMRTGLPRQCHPIRTSAADARRALAEGHPGRRGCDRNGYPRGPALAIATSRVTALYAKRKNLGHGHRPTSRVDP